MKRSKIKHSRSNQVFYIFNTIFWIIFYVFDYLSAVFWSALRQYQIQMRL